MRTPNLHDASDRRPVHLDGSAAPVGVLLNVTPHSGRAKIRTAAGRHEVVNVDRLTVDDVDPDDAALPALAAPTPVDVVDAIRAAIAAADETRARLEALGDWKGLAVGLDQVRALKRDLALLESTVTRSLAEVMPSRQEEVPGLGVIERQRAKSRRWPDPQGVLMAVVRSELDPDGTGELPGDPVEVMARIVDAVAECAPLTPSMNWRLGALRRRGIDPDAWAETTESHWSVRIHQGDKS